MTEKDWSFENLLKAIIASSKEERIKTLQDAGIVDSNNKLSETYKEKPDA